MWIHTTRFRKPIGVRLYACQSLKLHILARGLADPLPKHRKGSEEGNEDGEGNAEDDEGDLSHDAHGGEVEMQCQEGGLSIRRGGCLAR